MISLSLQVNESRVLKHYQYTEWTEDAAPANSAAVIDLIGVLQKAQHQNGGGPIVLHDRSDSSLLLPSLPLSQLELFTSSLSSPRAALQLVVQGHSVSSVVFWSSSKWRVWSTSSSLSMLSVSNSLVLLPPL